MGGPRDDGRHAVDGEASGAQQGGGAPSALAPQAEQVRLWRGAAVERAIQFGATRRDTHRGWAGSASAARGAAAVARPMPPSPLVGRPLRSEAIERSRRSRHRADARGSRAHGGTYSCAWRPIHRMHIKRWRRLRDGAPGPWQADKTPVNSAFGATTGRAAKNGRFGYATGVFHEETTSVFQ